MLLLNLIIILVAIGVIMWLINTYIPMSETIKKILNVVVIIAIIIWLLGIFGIIGSLGAITI